MKNRVWDEIKIIDSKYSDLTCDLSVDPSIAAEVPNAPLHMPNPEVVNGTPLDLILSYQPKDRGGNSLGPGADLLLHSLETVTLDVSKLLAEKLESIQITLRAVVLENEVTLGQVDFRLPSPQLVITLQHLVEKLGAIKAGVPSGGLRFKNDTDLYADIYTVGPGQSGS